MRMMTWLAAMVAAAALGACSLDTRPLQQEGLAVSDLPDAAPLDGSEYVLAVQDGQSVRMRAEDLCPSKHIEARK